MMIRSQRRMFFSAAVVLLLCATACKKTITQPQTELDSPLMNESDTVRLISYNILEGMKNDRANNYDNFVAWVKSYDPDVLALQEANGFSQEKLEALAARFGHKYVVTNPKASDNYPVALTSKFPIEVRRRVTLHVSHGAIFAKIKDFNIVVAHFWPQSYWHQQGDGLGNACRLQETNIILDSSKRKYPTEPNWLFVGDFNSVSRKDYAPGTTNQNFEVTNTIEGAGFTDAIHYKYGYKENNYLENGSVTYDFRYPARRIDFVFGTLPLLRKVVKAQPVYDEFTEKYSDHPPMLLEFTK